MQFQKFAKVATAIEEWFEGWLSHTVKLIFFPPLAFEENKPQVIRSFTHFIANCVVAYVFGMFMLLFEVGEQGYRSFNGVRISIPQIFGTVSILFWTFAALNVLANVITAILSWILYQLNGSRASLRGQVASLFDLSFIEFIAASFFVVGMVSTISNRPGYWMNEWRFNVGIGAFIVTRVWYLIVAIYAMHYLHNLPSIRRWLTFLIAFCPLFVIVNMTIVSRWWLSIADATMLQYRITDISDNLARWLLFLYSI